MTRRLLIRTDFLIAAACILSCCFVCSCENDQRVIDEWTKDKTMKEEATNIVSYLSQEGRMKAKLMAPLMLRVMTDTQYVEFPKTLHVDFYNDSVKLETWLDCKYAKYFETLDKVYLRDSVTVITVKGDTLKSPDLWWDQSKGLFYTDKFARYHSTDQRIYGGTGLEATQDLKTVTFKDPTGVVDISKQGIMQ